MVRVERLSRFGLRVGSSLELVSLGARSGNGGRKDGEDRDKVGQVHGVDLRGVDGRCFG